MHNLHSYQILTSYISVIPNQAALSRNCCLTTCTAGNLCWYSTQSRNTLLLSDRQTYAPELCFILFSPCSFEFLPTPGALSSSSDSQYCVVSFPPLATVLLCDLDASFHHSFIFPPKNPLTFGFRL